MPQFPNEYTEKTTPVGEDKALIADTQATNQIKSLSLTNIKNWLQSLTSWITTAMITDGAVTADKLALGLQRAFVEADESTNSTSFVDLTTTTDSVTVTVPSSGNVLVNIVAQINTANVGGNGAAVGFEASGANTISASFSRSALYQNNSTASSVAATVGRAMLLTGLNPGSTTFKMKYARIGGSGANTFRRREISVIPLG